MTRRQLVMLVLVVMVAAFIAGLALRTDKPPWMPEDADHAIFVDAEGCVVCHGPEGPLPRSRNHPVGMDCMRCHGRR
jgi:cytochrome c553